MWKEQKSGTRGDSRVCHWCPHHILTSSVIHHWTDARQHGIYLFYIIKKQRKELFYFSIFQHDSKAGLCPLWLHFGEHEKKPFDVINLFSIQKHRTVIGPGKSRHCQTWLERRFSCNENLQRKQNWTAKSTNLKENAGNFKSVFVIRAALWGKKLGRCLEYCRSWKNTLGKLAVAVNLEAIGFTFWMKGALVTVEICVFCGWWFSNHFEIVSETPFSCDTVGREL